MSTLTVLTIRMLALTAVVVEKSPGGVDSSTIGTANFHIDHDIRFPDGERAVLSKTHDSSRDHLLNPSLQGSNPILGLS